MAASAKQPRQRARHEMEQPGIFLPREEWQVEFPSAEELEKFSKVHPRAINFLFRRFKGEQDLRMEVLRRKVTMLEQHAKNEYSLERLAMRYAFIATCLALLAAVTMELTGHRVVSSVISCFAIAGMAGVFFKRKERRGATGSIRTPA